MQKNKFTIIVIITFVFIAFLGINFFILNKSDDMYFSSIESINEENYLTPLKQMCLNINDLPEGYVLDYEGNLCDEEEEFYGAYFNYNGIEEEKYSKITVNIRKQLNSKNWVEDYKDTIEFYFSFYEPISMNIGEENFAVKVDTRNSLKDFDEAVTTSVMFKISDIYCFLSWKQQDNYDFFFDLAKKIEERIIEYKL